VAVFAAAAVSSASGSSRAVASAADVSPRLAALVSGALAPDVRIAKLVPGHRRGELAYFVVLRGPKTPEHRAALQRLGARILREYRELDAFAVASRPEAVRRIARLPDVAQLVPVDLVETEAEVEGDQSRGTTADIGAPALWN
jgi:hypothetical protein